jgi:hypothetical protein
MGQLLGLIALLLLSAFLLLSPVGAQETPEMAPEEGDEVTQQTPVVSPQEGEGPLIRLEVDAPEEPIPKGEEIEVAVLVEDVEHLASFAFAIRYDPKRLEPVERDLPENGTPRATPVEGLDDDGETVVSVRDTGAFLATSERADGLICFDPVVSDREKVLVSCVTAGLPLCLDGLAGASGSGVLGRVLFESKGGGVATLELTDTMLVLDDVVPCDPDPDVGQAQEIAHRVEGAAIELASGDGIPWVIVGPVIAVVVVLVIGGGVGGFIWSRRGGSGTSP